MTDKQRTAVTKTLENLGSSNPKTTGEILRESGYSEAIAKNPKYVTESKGFIAALEAAGVSDDKLSQVMQEGLAAVREGKPDHAIRHKYLETAIKVKGHIKQETPGGDTYQTYIQQNNYNPNAPDAKTLVDTTLEMLMQQTKRD